MENLWKSSIFEEIIEISKEKDFIDVKREMIKNDEEIGEMTLLEKSIFTLYRREIARLAELEKLDLLLYEKERQVEITKEKIRTLSKLLVFLIRKRLNFWEMINIRKGFKIVKGRVYWTRKIKEEKYQDFLDKIMGVNIDKIAHG